MLMVALWTGLSFNMLAQSRIKTDWGEGIWFVMGDSTFTMNIRPRVQMRALVSNELRANDFAEEIFIRRARIWTTGYLFLPKLTYLFQLHFVKFDFLPQRINEEDFNRRPVRDLVLQYYFTPTTWLSFGQSKLPAHRSRIISSLRLQLIERGIDHAMLDTDRDIGFQFRTQLQVGDDAHLRLTLALTTGEGRNQAPDWRGLSYALRLEWLPFGLFQNGGDYIESDVFRENRFKVAVAGSYIFNHHAIRTSSQIGFLLSQPTNIQTGILDLLAKYRGWSFEVELLYRNADNPVQFSPSGKRRLIYHGIGGHLQAGYVFESLFEFSGRIAAATPFSSVQAFMFAQREVTVCVGKILVLPSIKVQADITVAERKFWNGSPPQSLTIVRAQAELGI